MGEENIRLIIIGGGEDKKAGMEILKEVVHLSGGKEANISVITTATNYPVETGEEYKKIFYDLGVNRADSICIDNRREANRKQIIKNVEEMDCIFFVGGDQLRISSILGGTLFHDYIKEELGKRLIVAGTSAGASMMSHIMVVEGEEEDAPRKCTIKLAPGMGFLQGVIIDQHFNQRGRIGRLLGAVAQNPCTIGIGIDEDTAVIVNGKDEMKVIGSGVITVIDGRNIDYINISEKHPNEPLALTNVNVHILPSGCRYDLLNRKALIYLTH